MFCNPCRYSRIFCILCQNVLMFFLIRVDILVYFVFCDGMFVDVVIRVDILVYFIFCD